MKTGRKTTKRSKKADPRGARSRRRTFVAVVRGMLVVSGLCGCAYMFTDYVQASTHFQVKTIRVEGANVLGSAEVAALSGVTRADNLLLLDGEAVGARVEAAPYVKHCRVRRLFPDMLHLIVEARRPVAALMAGDACYEIDAECIVLREIRPQDFSAGPLITNVAGLGPVVPGRQLDNRTLRAALSVWEAFSRTEMAKQVVVSEIAAFNVNDIQMYCEKLPYEIVWGRGGFEEQARRLDQLWRYKKGRLGCWEYVDLRFGRQLACR